MLIPEWNEGIKLRILSVARDSSQPKTRQLYSRGAYSAFHTYCEEINSIFEIWCGTTTFEREVGTTVGDQLLRPAAAITDTTPWWKFSYGFLWGSKFKSHYSHGNNEIQYIYYCPVRGRGNNDLLYSRVAWYTGWIFQLGVDGYFRNYEEYRKTLKGVSRPILTKTKTASLDLRKIKNPGQESNPLILEKKSHPVLLHRSIVLLIRIKFWEVIIYGKLKENV